VEDSAVQEAYRLIDEDRTRRAQSCLQDVNHALEKHRCSVSVELRKQGEVFVPVISIVARDNEV
jgi:hypothetical protein